MVRRSLDLTPTEDPTEVSFMKKIGMEPEAMGGADAFLDILEKEVKPHGKAQAEHIPGIIAKVLSGNDQGSINKDALNFVRARAKEMLHYFENHHSRRITGSSVLMLIDNVTKSYEMKIIDLSSS